MNEFKIYSLNDLYKRVKPALNIKLNEFDKKKKSYITKEDIFECLSKNKWKESSNLTLHDIVDDILSINLETIEEYLLQKLRKDA